MPTDKLAAEWFRADLWVGSAAYLLSIEARGLYREMLTRAWLLGASLPNDHAIIQRAIGCTAEEWARSWPAIAHYWRVEGDRLVNDKQLEIYAESLSKAETNSARGRAGASARWSKPEKADKPAGKYWKFSSLYVSPKMHSVIAGALGPRASGVDWDEVYRLAACDYAERGEPSDKLDDLKRRARRSADAKRDREVGPPSAEETAARLAQMEANRQTMTPEERKAAKERLRGVLSVRS